MPIGQRSLNLFFKRHHKAQQSPRMSIPKRAPKPPPVSTRHISDKAIRRIAYRAGIKKASARMYDEARKQLHEFVSKVIGNAVLYVEHRRQKTMKKSDVTEALKREGITVYE